MKLLRKYIIIKKRESHDSGKPLYVWHIAANYGDRGGYLSLSLFTSYIVFKKSSINCNVCKKSWYDILKPSLYKNLEGIFLPSCKGGACRLFCYDFPYVKYNMFMWKMQFYFLRIIFSAYCICHKHLQTTNFYSKI